MSGLPQFDWIAKIPSYATVPASARNDGAADQEVKERAAVAGVGFRREAVWLTSLMRVPALALCDQAKRAGAFPTDLPRCPNWERAAVAGVGLLRAVANGLTRPRPFRRLVRQGAGA